MLSTICTVNRSIPTSRLRILSRLTIFLSLLCASPAWLHAAPVPVYDTPTDAATISASVFLYVPFHFPDTSATTATAAATTPANTNTPPTPTATEGNQGIVAETAKGDEGLASGSAVPDAVSVSETYLEEQSGTAGFSLLAPYLDEFDRVEAPEPPWPDFGRFDVPISYNDRVKTAIHVLRGDASGVFAGWLGRTNRYRAMIQSILSRSGLPGDLVYVAMVESGFDPRARSREGGAGLWQLSPADAERYGLTRNDEIDERYDPEKSTRAAAARFKDLYLELGSWDLVMAAHHAGSEPVQRAGSLSLWNMRLPGRSIPFVAFVMASAIISKSPEVYGFEPLGGLPVIHESVPVQRAMVLEEVAEGMKVQVEKLRELNPELRRWKAVPGFDLNVPLGTKRAYATWAGIEPPGPDPSEMTFYRVRRGDTLGRISRRFGVRTGEIIAENNIRRPNRLRIGQVLAIPLFGSSIRSSNQSIANRRPRDVPPPDPATHQAISYRIRRGDTLARISRRYGVSMANLQDWNKLNNPGDIIAGRSLTIYVPRPSGTASGGATPTGTPGTGGSTRGEGGATASDAIIYTVKPGDTLWDIARAHNVTVSALRRTNGLGTRAAIHPGDRLRINPSDS
ncbi:MAG: LysM peptidoglycan-binding domain-containing protein [Gemmatimonadetes bacterium]|nr:LysM peptidoglycan-binding domain-containing protein [Gemmatimonadota bacterium]MYG15123.1 LysM peptidoglycan-binding domain-containing protein [Gemmatimonadota bacterium]